MTLKDFKELTKDLPDETEIYVGGRGKSDDIQVYGRANMFSNRDNKIHLEYDYFLNKSMGWEDTEKKVKLIGEPIPYNPVAEKDNNDSRNYRGIPFGKIQR